MKKLFVLLLFLPSLAWAVPIDFRSPAWGPAMGLSGYTVGNVTASALPTGALLYQDAEDGLGVQFAYEGDEVEENELLWLHFVEQMWLESILLSDLFYESGYKEQGSWSLDNSTWVDFEAPLANVRGTTNGELLLTIAPVLTTDLWFQAPGWIGTQTHEFSVASVEYSPIPEPATMLLVGLGLLGLGCYKRRKRCG